MKARQLGVAVTDVFETLQIYLGSLYVNDFNAFGRTYSVRIQADANYRSHAEDIGKLKVRSQAGEMIPLSALLKVEQTVGQSAQSVITASFQPTSTATRLPAFHPVRRRLPLSGLRKRPCLQALPMNGPT